MAITPIGNLPVTNVPLDRVDTTRRAAEITPKGAGEASFTDVIENLLAKANEPQLQADQAFEKLVTGESNNVHDVVMSAVKADLSFRLVLELRNRLTDAYQEIMRMQV